MSNPTETPPTGAEQQAWEEEMRRRDSEHEAREREYQKRRRQEPLMIMSAVIASGMSGNTDMTTTQVEDRALKIAQGLMTKIENLP